MNGKVEQILISSNAGEELRQVSEANLIQGKGIEGDRYFFKVGTFSEALEEKGDFEVTLIEKEEIDAFNELAGLNYIPADFRRNIVTSGVRLNDLVGKEISLGRATLFVVRLCEPCAHLASILGDSIMSNMVHKAGIRALIRQSGRVGVGNTIGKC